MLCGPVLSSEPWTHRAAGAAVLHVNKVVPMVPHALDAQEVSAVRRRAGPGQRIDEEVLLDATTPRQNQNPAVDPKAVQGVGRSLTLSFLLKTRNKESQIFIWVLS